MGKHTFLFAYKRLFDSKIGQNAGKAGEIP
ncbi:hypothetical protein EUBC25_07160 [Claveliimonas bilis]|nr:hypothetical protein EUBC25_07160 [Claveliimonas bilis]